MKQLGKMIRTVILLAFLLLAGNLTYAYQTVIPDSMAMEKARLSYIMHDADGAIYNLYIIGDNEEFVGARNDTWRSSEWDQIYEASSYEAYLTGPNSNTAIAQNLSLFGEDKSAGYRHRLNLTDPTYQAGAYVINGVNGQPEILVTTRQMSASNVDYRFYAIKNGELRPMKLMFSNHRTSTRMIGDHKPAYGLDDGTIGIPWFRPKTVRGGKAGRFITVFMPDFTNFILISAYTIND